LSVSTAPEDVPSRNSSPPARLERTSLDALDAVDDGNVFRTRAWLEYVARTQDAEPVVARLVQDGENGDGAGLFCGLIVRRFGVRILGSPFQGWMTGPMGFTLDPDAGRRPAADALLRFAFKDLNCLHVELLDRHATFDELDGLGGRLDTFFTWEIDLTQDEETLLSGMSSSCRRAIRKSEKEGVRIEEAQGVEFAEEYYEQLQDVFAKQGRRPPYGVDRVREMISCLEPTGNLLMVRAVAAGGERIATALFPVHRDFGYFWGGASWRQHQALRPNEAIFWYVIRNLKERGVPLLDMGGGGEFKKKFGPRERRVPILRRSRVPGLLKLRDVAAGYYSRRAMKMSGKETAGSAA
jgi:CelD/BcsL family acetyltransferase involved in cellulose biosynthesis